MTKMSFEDWLDEIRGRGSQDKDAVVIITGPERLGKSNLAYYLASKLDPTFTHRRMAFSGSEFMQQAVKLQRGRVLVLDEAISGGFSRDAMTKQNTNLVKFLVVAGERNLITFVLFPNIKFLDRYIKEHRAHYWVLVERRGQALFHKRLRRDYDGTKAAWQNLFRITKIPKIEGEDWGLYEEKKEGMVRDFGASSEEDRWVPTEAAVEALVEKFRAILSR